METPFGFEHISLIILLVSTSNFNSAQVDLV